MSSALLCNGSHAMDPPRRSHSLETRYDKEGMLGLYSPLSKGPHSTSKQYHAPAPMLGALLCNGSHAMDPPRRSHSLETRLDRAQLPLPRIYMLKTTDEMRRTGRTGWADGRTGKRGLRADERTGGRTGRRADGAGHAGRTSGRGRTMGRQADEGGQKHGRADGGRRTDDGFPKVKLPI